MKRTTLITMAMAIGLALFQPISAFAEEQDQKEKGQGKKEKTHGKAGDKSGNREQTSQQPRTSAPLARTKGITSHSENVNIKPSNAAVAHSRGSRSVSAQTVTAPSSTVTTRNSRVINNTTVTDQRSYTRSNSYGGLWVRGDTHRDWDRSGIHSWNDHRYGWYDGGWLIIDGGYRPSGYFGYGVSGPGYSGGSTVMQVQRRLDTQGYPVGYADGVMGPATHDGIAAYQRDYGLAVTGRINDPLLASLGLR